MCLYLGGKKTEVKTQAQIEKELLELNEQFSKFLKTKGIKAKFKLAFDNMKESMHNQHIKDVEQINAIKESEENKQFIEFIHTKGIKAKFKLVNENIKKGAKESRAKTAQSIAKVQAQTQRSIASVGVNHNVNYNAQTLEEEFNNFLKSKGLDTKYRVNIVEEEA